MTQKISMKLIPALMLLGFAGAASASGFAIQNQTGSGNGNAFSGAAAAAEDAGTIYFNPAGMTYLPMGHNVTAVGTILARKIEYKDTGTTTFAGGAVFPPGISIFAPTGDGGDAGGVGLIPAGYWSYAYSKDLRFGVGVSPTFGNETEYSKNFRGFNSGFFASMTQMNINPSIAFKLNDMISIGAGVNFAHNEIELKQGIPTTSTIGAFGLPPGNFVKITGDDWATGFNLGATFQLSPNTRVGLTYRSETRFDLEGKQKVNITTANPAIAALNTDVKASIDMPANASLAILHQMDRWQFLGDYTWTGWSSVDTVRLQNKNTGAQISTLPFNFQDTYRVGFGLNYQYNDKVKTRFGVAYDKAPVKSAVDRTMTLPDSDRTWLSFGVKYSLSKISSLDIGYSHIFFKDARTARPVPLATLPGGVAQTINGKWDNNSADLLSASYNHTF